MHSERDEIMIMLLAIKIRIFEGGKSCYLR